MHASYFSPSANMRLSVFLLWSHPLWRHCGDIAETLRRHCGDIVETLWRHCGDTPFGVALRRVCVGECTV